MPKFIKQINFPSDLKNFKKENLKEISNELRDELIDVVSETGGHLGAGLGVVELTVALHYVFDTPKDKLVWDVSHQCYTQDYYWKERSNKNFKKRRRLIWIYKKGLKANMIRLEPLTALLLFLQH